jgi:galactokinase
MKLADWLDTNAVTARLKARGMSAISAANAATCFAEAASALADDGVSKDAAVHACWSPGRIEVLGKHTDYCGGDSILAAVERGFCYLATARKDSAVRILNARAAEVSDFSLDPNLEPPIGHWSNYPQTVVRRLARNFPQAHRGATIAFVSNLPPSSGMSSSSAFVVGTFLLLSQINRLENDATYASLIKNRADLGGYLGTVENGLSFGPFAGDRGVGTFGGSEDQTAILCSQPGRLVQFSYCPVRFRRTIDLSDDYVFAIASSGVVAEKTGAALAKYNRVSAMVRTIVNTWRDATGRDDQSLATILASSPDAPAELRKHLNENKADAYSPFELIERLDQFIAESRLIAAVPDALHATTIGQFGKLVHESHRLADAHLKNQTLETNRLVQLAEELGASAASAFGAGFGGSVWALIDQSSSTQFLTEWRARYERKFQQHAERSKFLLTRPGVPAFTEPAA